MQLKKIVKQVLHVNCEFHCKNPSSL